MKSLGLEEMREFDWGDKNWDFFSRSSMDMELAESIIQWVMKGNLIRTYIF